MPDEGPGARHVGAIGVCLALAWLILLAVVDMYFLAAIWPHPTPSGLPATTETTDTTGTAPKKPAAASTATATGPTIICTDCAKVADKDQRSECDCWHRVASMQAINCKEGEAPPALKADPGCIYLWSPWDLGFGGWHMIWGETRLLFIVMLCGFLGALVFSLRSLFWYTGNRALVWSWIPYTTLVPVVGALLAVVFYLVLRGGLFSPTTTISDTSPFGFAAVSALVGMFIHETVLKLKSIFETIMTKKEQGSNSVTPTSRPGLKSIDPSSGPAGADIKVKLTGDHFVKDQSKVYADGVALDKFTVVSDTEIDGTIEAKTIPTAGKTVNISVQTSGGGASSPVAFKVT